MFKSIKNFLILKDKNGKRYRKCVMLYGFYGVNLGDDLFFEKLLSRYPDTMFLIYCTENYRPFFERFNNVKFYSVTDVLVGKINALGNKFKNRKFLSQSNGAKGYYLGNLFEMLLLWRSNATVHIGGSIYQQIGDWRYDLSIRKKRKRPFKPFFSISSNFGAYSDGEFRSLWGKEFKRYTDIAFRDRYSCEQFPRTKAVRYVPDLLFSYKLPDAPQIKGSVVISVYNPFFALRKTPEAISNAYRTALVKTVTDLISGGRDVTLLGFCSLEGDDAMVAGVIDDVPSPYKERVKAINYSFETRDAILNAISQAEFVIGTRLHSVILGLAADKKVLPLVYNQKIKNILDDIGFDGERINLEEIVNYDEEGLAPVLEGVKSFDVSSYANSDELQFLKLDSFLS